MSHSGLTIQISTTEDDHRPVYITGNFNNWDPRDPQFKLEKIEDDLYSILLDCNTLPEIVEYKFTRGGWENVELDQYGNITPNRKTNKICDSKQLISIKIPKWRSNWGPFKKEFFPIVELISNDFYIPQLERKRRVWALIPYNYYLTDKKYPVLYLQDAQNLFNEGSEYGNWEIDKKLSVLTEYGRGDVIIIAIEHGNEDRMKEYIFENNKVTDKGDGKKYIRFVTDTLKPYIDAKYRTLKDRENTGLGGSSLGALVSIFGGFLYPEVYGRLMVFSPSLWVFPHINFPMIQQYNPFQTKIYIYGGEKEGASMTSRIQKFVEKMEKWDNNHSVDLDFRVSINPEGSHQEFYWSQEFPRALEWLYFDSKKDPVEILKNGL